jgi:hypothetical protein
MSVAILDPAAAPEPPAPISVQQALEDLQVLLNQIRRKLRTLIDWYIFPNVVPDTIKAYDPRLQILQARLKSLARIDYLKLPYILDNSDEFASRYLFELAEQLQHSARGIQIIFVDHYDRDLADKQPFHSIWETLFYKLDQIKLFRDRMPSNPSRRPAELQRNPPALGNFCPGGLALSNGRDRGRISFVAQKDLTDENRRKLKLFQGAFLNWHCHDCAYKVRFHVSNSATSNIQITDEIREHPNLPIQYRSAFLAKCHLYQATPDRTSQSSDSTALVVRRDSLQGYRRDSFQSSRRDGFQGLKYGCVFCFAMGYDLDRRDTAFSTIRDFAEHIAHEHRRHLPPSMLIHRFSVAVDGKTVVGGRWDLNML